MIKKILFSWLIFQQTFAIYGQTLADTSFIAQAEVFARNLYADRMKDHIHLFEGSEYRVIENNDNQHPYFHPDWLVGSVYYNGNLFTGEEILYDIFKDQVIIQDYYGASFIQLVPEKVEYFYVDGHVFVRINNPLVKSGFYDLLVDGEIKLYAKRSKEFKETIIDGKVIKEYWQNNKYFLYRNNTFYPIRNKSSVKRVLSDFEDEIKSLVRSEKLQFHRSFESTVIKITKHCNEL